MPNKTIYVSDGDLPVFQRAQELAGGQPLPGHQPRLAPVRRGRGGRPRGLRRDHGPGRTREGPPAAVRGGRARGLGRSSKDRTEQFTVYRSRTGKYVVHCLRSPEYVHQAGPDGDAKGWRKHFSPDQVWGQTPPTATLEVFDSLEDLRETIPTELYALVAAAAEIPEVEDLDI